MDNKIERKILKVFIALYLVSFFAINWNDISWLFNYRVVSSITYDFFNPYQSADLDAIASTAEYSSPVPTVNVVQTKPNNIISETTTTVKPEAKYTYSENGNVLDIPAISISTAVVFPQTTDVNILKKYLDDGVIYHPTSVKPGQDGQIIILGHSAPDGWPHIKHDWVFSDLNDLKAGDKIMLTVDHKQYTYSVTQKAIIDRGAEIEFDTLTNSNKTLVLVSCWPPGKDYKRIAVQASLAE
jgi:LPXTG-site transpeptidase (sortase) family protein